MNRTGGYGPSDEGLNPSISTNALIAYQGKPCPFKAERVGASPTGGTKMDA